MTRSKKTARISTAGLLPRAPLAPRVPAPVPDARTEVLVSDGPHGGTLAARLQGLLRDGGYRCALTLRLVTKKTHRPGRDEWISRVEIIHDGRLVKVHRARAWRRKRVWAEDDAFWEAITGQSHLLAAQLADSRYRYLPQRRSGTANYSRAPVEGDFTACQLILTADTEVGLAWRYDHLQREHQTVLNELKFAEMRLREQAGEPSLEETWSAGSPGRRAHAYTDSSEGSAHGPAPREDGPAGQDDDPAASNNGGDADDDEEDPSMDGGDE
jgi:hypothetical protein